MIPLQTADIHFTAICIASLSRVGRHELSLSDWIPFHNFLYSFCSLSSLLFVHILYRLLLLPYVYLLSIFSLAYASFAVIPSATLVTQKKSIGKKGK